MGWLDALHEAVDACLTHDGGTITVGTETQRALAEWELYHCGGPLVVKGTVVFDPDHTGLASYEPEGGE